jgi:hypothetical protein
MATREMRVGDPGTRRDTCRETASVKSCDSGL